MACTNTAHAFYPPGVGPRALSLVPFGLTLPLSASSQYTEKVSVYGGSLVTGSDLNTLPSSLFLLTDCLPINIHRGTPRSRDDAAVLGILNIPTADAYTSADFGSLLSDRFVLQDEDGVYWVVRNVTVRKRFAATAHTRLLLTMLAVTPDGLT